MVETGHARKDPRTSVGRLVVQAERRQLSSDVERTNRGQQISKTISWAWTLALALHWDVAMSSVIETLREEHKNIGRLLNAMEDQIERLATASNRDFDLLQSIANYFCDYPDRCHHPKENAILRQLHEMHPAEAATVGDLAKEHRDACARAHRFRDNISAIFRDQFLLRDKLLSAGRSFIDAEREHMKMEENLFFPLAESVLDEEDWRSIEGNIRQMQDPLFGELVEKEFRILREFLLSWERENRRI
jgi:hemerythrin-like domain-containing protein